MLHALAELREGAVAVADTQHEGRIGDVRLNLFLWDAQMRRRTGHIANDAPAVRTVLHKGLPDVEYDLHLAVERFIVVAGRVLNARCFHRTYRVPFSSNYNFYTL